jgi:two-component system response regulator AtoC
LLSENKDLRVHHYIDKIAVHDVTVLINGESGTGKELVAACIHDHSNRREGPFIKLNCASLAANLLESELFGHEKGAFTGAVSSHTGKFELAHKGTLFLDEIGEMSMATQVKMLRVIQEKEFERVGGTKSVKVDVRLISATNRNLMAAIKSGIFREDLYFRLNVINLLLPPLRERKEDIILLSGSFLDKFNKKFNRKIKDFSREAIKELMNYNWPGNVRELENTIARAVILACSSYIEPLDLGLTGNQQINDTFSGISQDSTLKDARKEFDRYYIKDRMKKFNGSISKTARSLDMERTNFYRLIKNLGIKE